MNPLVANRYIPRSVASEHVAGASDTAPASAASALPAPASASGNSRANVPTWFLMSPPRRLIVLSKGKGIRNQKLHKVKNSEVEQRRGSHRAGRAVRYCPERPAQKGPAILLAKSAQAASAAKREVRVAARGTARSQSPRRPRSIAAAVATCCRWVLASPR